jgi:hypothetical protein
MVVVAGGHSRNIGKTSVVCGVIRALPGWNWTAIKITQHGHGILSRDGEACDCSDPAHPITVSEETGATPSTDSGRFLAAGAARALWVRTPAGELNEAMPRLRRILAESENVIIESNSVLRFLQPDVCAMVLDGGVADFKPTSLRFLDRANVLVVTGDADLAWPQVSASLLRNKPRFAAPPPRYESPEFIAALVTANSDLFSAPKLLK